MTEIEYLKSRVKIRLEKYMEQMPGNVPAITELRWFLDLMEGLIE